MIDIAMILVGCIAAFLFVFLMEGTQEITVHCRCRLHSATLLVCVGNGAADTESDSIAARLTELCPVCRKGEIAP